MATRPSLPSKKAIMDYWREWVWERHADPPEEHFCWACGWVEEQLDRAHIHARCEGGTDTVDNLHLLCRTCHRVSEYLQGDDYWKWMNGWGMMHRLMLEQLKVGVTFGLDNPRPATLPTRENTDV
jgi:hypothetical protein